MISADRMKSVRIAPLILSRSNATMIDGRIDERIEQLLLVLASSDEWQKSVRDLLEAFVAEEQAADHQQRRDRPRRERADRQRGGNEDRLVHQRALRHRPDDRQLAIGADAGNLLRVQREVVAEHARRSSSWRPWSAARHRPGCSRCRRSARAGSRRPSGSCDQVVRKSESVVRAPATSHREGVERLAARHGSCDRCLGTYLTSAAG